MIDSQNLAKLLEFLHRLEPDVIEEVIKVAEAVMEEKRSGKKTYAVKRETAELTDDSLMPFGKFKGNKLATIDEGYLLWLYGNRPIKGAPALEKYIKDRFEIKE